MIFFHYSKNFMLSLQTMGGGGGGEEWKTSEVSIPNPLLMNSPNFLACWLSAKLVAPNANKQTKPQTIYFFRNRRLLFLLAQTSQVKAVFPDKDESFY